MAPTAFQDTRSADKKGKDHATENKTNQPIAITGMQLVHDNLSWLRLLDFRGRYRGVAGADLGCRNRHRHQDGGEDSARALNHGVPLQGSFEHGRSPSQ